MWGMTAAVAPARVDTAASAGRNHRCLPGARAQEPPAWRSGACSHRLQQFSLACERGAQPPLAATPGPRPPTCCSPTRPRCGELAEAELRARGRATAWRRRYLVRLQFNVGTNRSVGICTSRASCRVGQRHHGEERKEEEDVLLGPHVTDVLREW